MCRLWPSMCLRCGGGNRGGEHLCPPPASPLVQMCSLVANLRREVGANLCGLGFGCQHRLSLPTSTERRSWKTARGEKNLLCLPPLLASWLNSLVMYLKTHWAVNPNVSNNYYHSNTPLSVWTLEGKEKQIFLSLSSLDVMGHSVRLHSGFLTTETEQLQTLIELSSYINIKQDCFPFQIFLFSCCAVQDHTHTR